MLEFSFSFEKFLTSIDLNTSINISVVHSYPMCTSRKNVNHMDLLILFILLFDLI